MRVCGQIARFATSGARTMTTGLRVEKKDIRVDH
jgi:hypothetical protein